MANRCPCCGAMRADENTVGGRLASALARHPELAGDRKRFAKIMRERMGAGGGTSYQSVLSYFSGRYTPQLDWVVEAAVVLGVNPSWLGFGGDPQ